MSTPYLFLALILGVANVMLVVWGGRRKTVAPLISITWAVHGILWCILPLLIQPFINPIENSSGPLSRAQLAVLHSSLLLLLVLAHLAMKNPRVGRVTA